MENNTNIMRSEFIYLLSLYFDSSQTVRPILEQQELPPVTQGEQHRTI